MKKLRIYVYDNPGAAVTEAVRLIERLGHYRSDRLPLSDLAVAPLLTQKLGADDIYAPRTGTLIFHPSLLPRHRGRDAIKWAYELKEPFTGVTWFWAAEGYDTGDICEQEVLPLDLSVRPRDFYERGVIPAMVRTLAYAIGDISEGVIRRRPQNEAAATYEPPYKRGGAA